MSFHVRLAAIALLTALAGCEKSLEPTQPEGGLQRLSHALGARDPAQLWQIVSPEVRQLFADAYVDIETMRDLVTHLQPAEQAEARRRAGLEETASVESAEALFAWFLRSELISVSDGQLGGMRAELVEMDGEGSCVITTRAEQNFTLVLGEDQTWLVHEPLFTLFSRRLEPIRTSRENLGATVALFGVRRDQREALRAFGVGDGSGAR